MVLDAVREALVRGVQRRPLRHRPGHQRALDLEAEVEVQVGRVVTLHHEAGAGRSSSRALLSRRRAGCRPSARRRAPRASTAAPRCSPRRGLEHGAGLEERAARHRRVVHVGAELLDADVAGGERRGDLGDDAGVVGPEELEVQSDRLPSAGSTVCWRLTCSRRPQRGELGDQGARAGRRRPRPGRCPRTCLPAGTSGFVPSSRRVPDRCGELGDQSRSVVTDDGEDEGGHSGRLRMRGSGSPQ